MRKGQYMKALGALAIAGIGMSACSSASQANVGTLPPILTQAQQRVANNKGYLPIYAQFSNKVTKLGYPITVPDAIRIPLPQILATEIKDTSKPTVNGVWVGTGSPDMRMAIYAAKVWEAMNAYMPTQSLYNATSLAQQRSLNAVFASSPAVLNEWMGSTSSQSLFAGDNRNTVYTNDWLVSARILADKTPTLSTSTPVVGQPMTVGFCASTTGAGVTDPAANEFNAVYNATATNKYTVTVVPSTDLSHVWKISQFAGVNGSSPC